MHLIESAASYFNSNYIVVFCQTLRKVLLCVIEMQKFNVCLSASIEKQVIGKAIDLVFSNAIQARIVGEPWVARARQLK